MPQSSDSCPSLFAGLSISIATPHYGTWRFMGSCIIGRAISKVTILITQNFGLVTPLITAHEPPSSGVCQSGIHSSRLRLYQASYTAPRSKVRLYKARCLKAAKQLLILIPTLTRPGKPKMLNPGSVLLQATTQAQRLDSSNRTSQSTQAVNGPNAHKEELISSLQTLHEQLPQIPPPWTLHPKP